MVLESSTRQICLAESDDFETGWFKWALLFLGQGIAQRAEGGNRYDLPFPALSIVRWGNAFKKEALQSE